MSAALAQTDSNRSEWNLALSLGALVLGLAGAVWGWQQVVNTPDMEVRAAPVYLSIDKIEAHMSDGSVLAFKFGLELDNTEDQKVLSPYTPAFRTMVEAMTTELTHPELAGPHSLEDMGDNIQITVNNYLIRQGMTQRVQGVLFEDWLLLM